MKARLYFVLALPLLLYSCSHRYHVSGTQTSQLRIKADSLKVIDSAVFYMIAPYKQKLDSQMAVVIGNTHNDLLRAHPEGTLGNLVADAALEYAINHYDKTVDLCVLNYGGIRLPAISKGTITMGKIYELMPFENELVLLEVSGQTLQQLLDLAAANDGWPVSGVIMEIRDKKAVNVFTGTIPINIMKTYTIVTNDYVANGGDNAGMLKAASRQISLHYKVRDAITDYIRTYRNFDIRIEKRVTRAN